MKKLTSALAVFVGSAMVVTSAFAQAGGGAGGAGGGAAGGGAAGGASGSGAAGASGSGASGSGASGSGVSGSGTSGSGVSGSGTSGSGVSGGGSTSGATTGSPATGSDKSRAEEPKGSSSGTGVTGTTTTSPSASPSTSAASGDFTGRHTMEGEVTKVDAKKGHLTLKTAEGNMDLHFPPSALANVKKGDRISVELAMKPAGSASMKDSTKDKDAKGAASPKTEKEKKY